MSRRAREDGYVLFGIIIGVVILGIFMGAAVPLWQKIAQREREKELIFRGYQYMQAIELYQRKFPGAFPPTLEILVEQKFLRKAYADPMTEDGEWKVLRQLSPELQMGGVQQDPRSRGPGGLTSLNQSRSQLGTPGQRQPQPTGGQFQSSIGRGTGDATLGGIVGVVSRSEEETFYKVPGKEKYNEWFFVYGVAQPGMPVPVPGQGQGQSPGQTPGFPPSGPNTPRMPGFSPGGPNTPQAPGFSPGGPNTPQAPGFAPGGPNTPRRPGQPSPTPGRTTPGQPPVGAPPLSGHVSPFPGLPPPPGLTSFRFGSAGAGAGALPPGATPQPGAPNQQRPSGFGAPSSFGTQPGMGQPQQPPRQQRRPPQR